VEGGTTKVESRQQPRWKTTAKIDQQEKTKTVVVIKVVVVVVTPL
jgi:hypothetical protein